MLTRRQFATRLLLGVAAPAIVPLAGMVSSPVMAEPAPVAFDWDTLVKRVETMANGDYQRPGDGLPKALADLDYDRFRDIRFRNDRAIWRDQNLPYQMQLFHLGFMYKIPVAINILEDGMARRVPFQTDFFNYGKNDLGILPADLGYAGFRLHAPMNTPSYYDEVISFLGSSYFRAIGKGQIYGLSARGLAIDTAVPSGEEFPVFREFWIEKPKPDATSIRMYGLLDSRSAVGAYRFDVVPGDPTEVKVKTRLILRQDVAKLGLAPLTSMFLYGEENVRTFDDFRPEVHDSDGLLMQHGTGEWVWRPLGNPRKLRVSAYQSQSIRGFGLLQRDRDFRNYEDLEALYHQRPSCWIEPTGDWGPGRVELIEIPTELEKYDNIVAFWVPADPAKAKDSLDLEYRMLFAKRLANHPPSGRVTATRTSPPPNGEPGRRFLLDFAGTRLADLKAGEPVELVVSAARGQIRTHTVQKNIVTGGWRAFFDFVPEDARPTDLRAFLRLGSDDVLSETWSYQWPPTP